MIIEVLQPRCIPIVRAQSSGRVELEPTTCQVKRQRQVQFTVNMYVGQLHTYVEAVSLHIREANESRFTARMLKQEEPILATWPDFLEMDKFDSPIAKELASVLKEPQRSHPVWFKEAEIAVRRLGLPLDNLSYDLIKLAIDQWRRQREDY